MAILINVEKNILQNLTPIHYKNAQKNQNRGEILLDKNNFKNL